MCRMTTAKPATADTQNMSNRDAWRARRRAKLTQREVAAELDIAEVSYGKWENGERGLAWGRTPQEVFEAIERLKARKNNPDA